jgi:peptidoglycan/LPS O-acetylase OafA/YrhL
MSTANYRPDIQGLRAVAVLAVMVFHFNPVWLPGGFVGVDVFLVISGFLITSILLHKKAQAGYSLTTTLKYFYSSRFKRIAPAYFVMLVLVTLVAAVFFLPQDFNTFKKGLEKAAWFNSNNYFAGFGDYFAPANHEQPLLHTWSLAVEIQFYLLAPFMVLMLPIRWLKWVFTSLLIGLTAIAEYRMRILGIEQATYYSLYARLPEFLAGALVALYVTTVSGGGRSPAKLGTLGLLLIVMATITQPLLGPFPGIAALLPVAGSALLLSQPAQGWVGKLLSCKTLVWIGALSYSLYLWHWPVLAFLRYYTGAEVLSIEFSLLFILLTLVLSIISYFGVERAFRTKRTNKKQALGWALLAGSVLSTSQVMAKVNAVFTPEQLPIEYRRYADPETICHGKIIGDCLKGDLSSDREVLVLGDSHAAMLNHFFDYLGKELGFKARIITASSCVTIPGFDWERIPEYAQIACINQIEEAVKYLTKIEKIFIAGSWSWQLSSNKFQDVLEKFLVNQSQVGSKVYILEQEPLLTSNPLRALRFKALGMTSNIAINSDYQESNNVLQRLSSRYAGVTSLNFETSGIFNQAPFSNGMLIYLDKHHLNEEGAKRYAKAALGEFAEIID